MEKKFKIGDYVKIIDLSNLEHGGSWHGIIGTEGKIVGIENGDGSCSDIPFYRLHPLTPGVCFPANCLKLIKAAKSKIKGTLFNIDDL
jgi:hypothetical protein